MDQRQKHFLKKRKRDLKKQKIHRTQNDSKSLQILKKKYAEGKFYLFSILGVILVTVIILNVL